MIHSPATKWEAFAPKARRKAIRRKWRKCFWTRPLGHIWENAPQQIGTFTVSSIVCAWCGKKSSDGFLSD